MKIGDVKTFYPKNRKEWRDWLEKNHKKEKAVAIIRYKNHTGRPSLPSKEAMYEAICFGWIDTTVKGIDDEKYLINFRRRNEKTSRWSKNTLNYAKQLIKEGKMSPEGLRFYKLGLSRKTHDHGIPKNPKLPKDMKEELSKRGLLKNFQNLSRSAKRMHLRWIFRAKKNETRIKRINEIIRLIKKIK